MPRNKDERGGSLRYTNVVLTAVAGLLALHLAVGAGGVPLESSANADRSRPASDADAGMLNPTYQRLEMIREIRKLNKQFQSLSSRLGDSPFQVEVIKMPKGTKGD